MLLPMQHGICLPIAGPCADPRVLADLGGLAEEAGWNGVFLEDYIVDPRDSATCDPWIALAAIASRTSRVRLGTTVTPLARRRPWKVAREVTTLDWLSGGRMVLGVGAGDRRDTSWERFGEEPNPRRRGELLDAALERIDRYWSGELEPSPLQKPRVPVWVGGFWPRRRPVARAARWDGAVIGWKASDGDEMLITADDLMALRSEIRRLRGGDDRGSDYVMGGAERWPDITGWRELVKSMAAAGATWWLEYTGVSRPLKEIRNLVSNGPMQVG
jgi:alkanesulfonate monooxygenase SsuD/methylene tetrahydromethanopterin reductase-like flavin-dependent oxidoreductase (luciferase family)